MTKSFQNSDADALIAQLKGTCRIAAFEAAKQVQNTGGNGLSNQLIEVLRNGRRPFNRAAAAYAMRAVSNPRIVAALERAVCDPFENANVRGHAAEALAQCHRKSTHRLLLKLLQDPSKEVRFWCAFALGQMREKNAVPMLELLRSDKRQVRGFHSVATEATDAITYIEERKRGQRCPYCIRNSRR